MKEYVYENPVDNGFKRVYLSRKKHNQLFVNRKLKWYNSCEYYVKDNRITIHRFINWIGILLETILLPVSLLLCGLRNGNELWDEYKRLLNQKKYGSFSCDDIWSGYTEKGVFKPNEFFNKVVLEFTEKPI